MAYGNLKADNLIYDDNGTDTVVPLAHVAGKASVDSQTFTGNVVLPATTEVTSSPAANDSSTKLATTEYVTTAVAAVDLSAKADVADPNFTGQVDAPSIRIPEISGTYPSGYLEFGDPGGSSDNGLRMGFSNTTSNGIIQHLDTAGDLQISSGKDVVITNTTSSGTRAEFKDGAGVNLFHAGTQRLATTAPGVDVSGDLDVSGDISAVDLTLSGDITAVDLTLTGNLTVAGTTTEINSTTLTVDDKNIELATVADISGQTATITAGQSTVTVTSTAGYLEGATVTKTGSEAGDFNAASVTIASIDSATQFTVSAAHATTGAITFDVDNTTDLTANGGGITLKGSTDKTILWNDTTDSWDFNQDIKTSGTVTDSKGDVRKIPRNDRGDNSYTLDVSDAGKHVSFQASADNAKTLTINASVFDTGDAVTVVNHSAFIVTIAVGAGMNLYNSADGTTPTALAGRGMATFLFWDDDICYSSGAGLS